MAPAAEDDAACRAGDARTLSAEGSASACTRSRRRAARTGRWIQPTGDRCTSARDLTTTIVASCNGGVGDGGDCRFRGLDRSSSTVDASADSGAISDRGTSWNGVRQLLQSLAGRANARVPGTRGRTWTAVLVALV